MIFQERMSKILKKIESLKSHPSDYPELLWVIFVFIGGVVNAVAIRQVANWFSSGIQFNILEAVIVVISSGAFLFIIPIFLSWFFSRNHPEKRLVPPLFIQGVTFGLLFFFSFNQFPEDFLYVYVLGIYVFVGGKIQDAIMVYSLGKRASSLNIIKYSFKVNADIGKVKEIVLTSQFRYLFELRRKIEKENATLKLRTSKNDNWQIIIELKETKNENETIINFAFFDEGSYYLNPIQKTDNSYEYALSKIEHIQKYFLRRYSIKVESAPVANAESLVNFILDTFEGRLTRFQEMATQKRVSVILSSILIPTSIVLFAYGEIGAGISTLVFGITLIINFIIP